MQHQWHVITVVVVLLMDNASVCLARRLYPYASLHEHTRHPVTIQPPLDDIANYLTSDTPTGQAYNPYGKHHPGRHVCSNQRNTTQPVKTMQPYCKPVYKKIVVNCGGNQICTGVRKEYEREYRPVTTNKNIKEVTYFCCPGWSRDSTRTHGCNKPVCRRPCENGGICLMPNTCKCPKGFSGPFCEQESNMPICRFSCENGGKCINPDTCSCLKGFQGRYCEYDVDECKEHKPCDHICYNTLGSYRCECKESFTLQNDGQSCRKEDDDGTSIEGKEFEFELLDKRLLKLETMINESHKNDATKSDIANIHKDMDHITKDVNNIKNNLSDMEGYKTDMYTFKNRLYQVEQKAQKIDDLMRRYEKMKRCAFHNKICI